LNVLQLVVSAECDLPYFQPQYSQFPFLVVTGAAAWLGLGFATIK